MLLYFKTANTRSFDEEVEFSMIAADYGDKLLENTVPIEKYGISVLKSSIIYGANASGKSNLLKAIADGLDIILKSSKNVKDDKLPHFHNKNNEANISKPTSYVFGILVDNTIFEYMFSNIAERIIEEKLIEHLPESQTTHFHREYDPDADKYDWAFGEEFDNETSSLIRKLIVKKNNLFLSSVANLPEDNESRLVIADNLYEWFKNKCESWVNSSELANLEYVTFFQFVKDKDIRNLFLEIMKQADFTIKDIKIRESEGENDEKILSAKTFHDGTDIKGRKVKVEYDFLEDESRGTQSFTLCLVSWMRTFSKNQVLIIDEWTNSIHPQLSEFLIDLFHKCSGEAQLLFTTHDVKLMDRKKIRDDQIWLVSRDRTGNSMVESVSNYAIDDDKLLDNVYLQGVLGGIPDIRKNEITND